MSSSFHLISFFQTSHHSTHPLFFSGKHNNISNYDADVDWPQASDVLSRFDLRLSLMEQAKAIRAHAKDTQVSGWVGWCVWGESSEIQ